MKILNAQQIREADKFTIQNKPISSVDLMEKAAKECALRIAAMTKRDALFYIFCGKGNNGGDGLAIARLLAAMKRKVEVFIIDTSTDETRDFATNLKRLEHQGQVTIHRILQASAIKIIRTENSLIIDALLGTGINKAVEGLLAEVIDFINSSFIPVISVDIPSGLFCDVKPGHPHIIKAFKTFTFQRPKLTFLFADFYSYVGDFEVLDIGLDETFI